LNELMTCLDRMSNLDYVIETCVTAALPTIKATRQLLLFARSAIEANVTMVKEDLRLSSEEKRLSWVTSSQQEQKVPETKQYNIERQPLVLCINLKRFNLMRGKNSKPVTLARKINISNQVRWATRLLARLPMAHSTGSTTPLSAQPPFSLPFTHLLPSYWRAP